MKRIMVALLSLLLSLLPVVASAHPRHHHEGWRYRAYDDGAYYYRLPHHSWPYYRDYYSPYYAYPPDVRFVLPRPHPWLPHPHVFIEP